jgi:hypothetical protein
MASTGMMRIIFITPILQDRYPYDHPSPTSWLGIELQAPAYAHRPLPHDLQAEMLLASSRRFARMDPPAIILNADPDLIANLLVMDENFICACMLTHIGQCFLDDP